MTDFPSKLRDRVERRKGGREEGGREGRERGMAGRHLDRVHTTVLSNQQTSNVCLLVGCLTSQQHASVSQGRICSDNFTCCHTEIDVGDQTFHLNQSQYTDTGQPVPALTL